MIRFYGMSKSEVESMTLDEFSMYWEAITILEAQESLLNMNVAAYPMMKKEEAKKFHKDVFIKAFPGNKERMKRRLTTAELAQLTGAGIIGEIKPNGG